MPMPWWGARRCSGRRTRRACVVGNRRVERKRRRLHELLLDEDLAVPVEDLEPVRARGELALGGELLVDHLWFGCRGVHSRESKQSDPLSDDGLQRRTLGLDVLAVAERHETTRPVGSAIFPFVVMSFLLAPV